jgi:mitotic spindle assembly checkpoint protein MAD1
MALPGDVRLFPADSEPAAIVGCPDRRPGCENRGCVKSKQSSAPVATLTNSLLQISSFRATQPTYNLFTGAETNASQRPASRQSYAGESTVSQESSKENRAPPDAEEYESQRRCIEELKAEIGTLRYTISTYEQEKVMTETRHNTDMEELRRKAQEDNEMRQSADAEKSKFIRQYDTMKSELDQLQESVANDKKALDKRAREAEEEVRVLKEQLDDLSTEKDEAARIGEKKNMDLQVRLGAAQRSIHELEQETQAREAVLQQTQAQLADKDVQIGNLEADILRLKAQTGDADTMAIIKKELSEQISHIRALEAANQKQLAELKHFKQIHKAVEVVEEEKRSLLRRLESCSLLEAELTEAKIQRQRLEDEQLAWTAYLKNEARDDMQFDSPEEMARALVQERIESASYVEKIGVLQAEVADRDGKIHVLGEETAKLKAELEKVKSSPSSGTSSGSADKARMRLDRQRALAVQEVEYLRAQLRTFDAEDITFQPDNYDEQKARRIQDLEILVDQYKAEVQGLHTELSSIESSTGTPQPALGTKRPRAEESDSSEQLGQLARKTRKLQDELSAAQTSLLVLEKELSVSREQLAAAQEQNKVRILSLRSNPTTDHEAIKLSTLTALKLENAELRAHIQSQPKTYTTIPATQLLAAQREIADAKAETASAQKSARRLKEVWAAKSAEFKEAIFSTLGWTVVFMPNGKMRVESVFYPSATDEHENSIVFDGEKGTMKVGGGPRSAFAGRINDQIKFWVRERGCIPGFLAALTLEFYDEQTRASAQK